MRRFALVLTCMACGASGKRVLQSFPSAESQKLATSIGDLLRSDFAEDAMDLPHPLAALATLLSAFNPSVVGNQRTASRSLDMQNRLGVRRPMMRISEQSRQDVLRALAAASTLIFLPPAAMAKKEGAPTKEELSKLTLGLSRIDYLLENWEDLTTECKGGGKPTQSAGPRTLDDDRCERTPRVVQKFIGQSKITDPLFKADKLMQRAEQLMAEDKKDEYNTLVEKYISKVETSSMMAYTSAWSGYENPGGSREKIDEAVTDTKTEVVATQKILSAVVDMLGIPRAPKYDPAANFKELQA